MTAADKPLDTVVEIITPENIAFQYAVAGPFQRLGAYGIDLLIQIAAMFGLGLFVPLVLLAFGFQTELVTNLSFAFASLLFFFISWFYGAFFEALWRGQTPGKKALELRVVTVDGQPINGFQAVMRNLLRGVDCLPLVPPGTWPLYQVGLFTAALTPRLQRMGDLAAGTMVIAEPRRRAPRTTSIRERTALALAKQLPHRLPLSRAFRMALANYVDRRSRFSPARRFEIARAIGEPLHAMCQMPPDVNTDLLLCAIYVRLYQGDESPEAEPSTVASGALPQDLFSEVRIRTR